MLPLAMVNGYDTTLTQLSTAALADLRALIAATDGLPPERARRVLQESFPEVFDPYAAATSAVSASFYEEVRDYANAPGPFAAETLDSVDSGRWGALAGYGASDRVMERGGSALVYSLLAGGLTSILSEMAGDTIYGNAANERVTMGFQRVPKAGCCGFCALLASRGAAYTSKKAAEGVVGRGVPVGEGRGKGVRGRGGGIKARGSRSVGQSFHDHCRCRAVQVYEDSPIELREGADRYFNVYAEARDKINDGLVLETKQFKAKDGSLTNKYEWVDGSGSRVSSDDKTKMIIKAMRVELGVK